MKNKKNMKRPRIMEQNVLHKTGPLNEFLTGLRHKISFVVEKPTGPKNDITLL